MDNKRHELIITIIPMVVTITVLVSSKIYTIITGQKLNENIEITIIVGIILPLIAFFVINEYIKEKSRQEKIKDYCFKNNIEFSQNISFSDLPPKSKSCLSLNRGTNPKLNTLMKKQRDGLTFFLFDYSFEIIKENNYKNNKDYSTETICLINKPNLNLTPFTLRDSEFSMPNLNNNEQTSNLLKEDKDFCKKFHILSNSKTRLDLIFNKPIREGFKNKHISGYKYEAKNDFFIVSKQGKLDLNERLNLLKQAMDIFALVSSNNLNFE